MKNKGKERADEQRGAKKNEIRVGDLVLQKNVIKNNKLTTPFNECEFEVSKRKGPEITVVNRDTGEQYQRIVTHVKKIPESTKETTKKQVVNTPKESEDLPKRPRRDVGIPKRFRDD